MRYPGVGRKTAERFALHSQNHFKDDDYERFSEVLLRVKEEIRPCSVCGMFTDQERCGICRDESRDQTRILVVEESRDVLVFERGGDYRGLYHVLGGVLSPSEGVGPDQLRIRELLERLRNHAHEELILATNLSDEGETTALYIQRLLKDTDVLVTRIAYGLPAGGDVSYADEVTLGKALEGRKKI